MALLNFQGRFVDDIEANRKRQTIRAFRKYPIKPGEKLYLYTGLRTEWSRKLGEAACTEVRHIIIKRDGISLRLKMTLADDGNVKLHYHVDRIYTIDELNAFAVSDGFKSWDEMKRWWVFTHELPWHGQLIKWIKL